MKQSAPFEVGNDIPNAETKAAMDEIAEMKAHPEKYKSYASFQELLDEIVKRS